MILDIDLSLSDSRLCPISVFAGIHRGYEGWSFGRLVGSQSVGRLPSLSEVGLDSRPTEKPCQQRQLPKLSPASRVPAVKSGHNRIVLSFGLLLVMYL